MSDHDLLKMTDEELRSEVLRLRDAIRSHRSKQSELYRLLPEGEDSDQCLRPRDPFLNDMPSLKKSG